MWVVGCATAKSGCSWRGQSCELLGKTRPRLRGFCCLRLNEVQQVRGDSSRYGNGDHCIILGRRALHSTHIRGGRADGRGTTRGLRNLANVDLAHD
eukprot:scaffold198688_cov26-Tisochrysis_lutea.AAC.1